MTIRVLVTGYGGFLGSAICRALLDQGYTVRGIARHRYADLIAEGVEPIEGDLRDVTSVEWACANVDAVIHTAAIASVWGPRSDFESINVLATQHLIDQSLKSGIRAFVYSSSPSVTFDGRAQRGVDESAPYPKHWLCDYPRTKAHAEHAVLKSNSPGRWLCCSLRPHLIWGTGDPHLIPRLIDRCKRGKLIRVGTGRNLIDTVHVEQAAEAHVIAMIRLLEHDTDVAGRAFFITDGNPIECWRWIAEILQGAGLEVPSKTIPYFAAYALGAALEFSYRALGKQTEPPMTRFVAAQLAKDHYFSIDAAKRLLGYSPIENRQAKFDAMVPWLERISAKS